MAKRVERRDPAVSRGCGGFARERVAGRGVPARPLPRQVPAEPHPPLPARRATERPEFRRFYDALETLPPRGGRPGRRSTRRASTRSDVIDGLRQARRVRDEDPGRVRRPRHEPGRVRQGDAAPRELRREPHRAPLRAPVDRRAAAAQALRLDELKKKYLPRIAKGAISAFALTETRRRLRPGAAHDHRRAPPDGKHYVLNGSKLWCTNGTIAELLVVMARNPKTNAISAFVVESDWPGVEVTHRCRFMGLRALANARSASRT